MTILLIDDDKEFLSLLSQSMSKRDFTVHTALNGMAALTILSENKIDLIISDVIMFSTPIMSLTCTLKNLYPRIPLIIVSGFTSSALIENSIILGADKFIPKPININLLVTAINKLTAA
jgi:DNA-binding NtrC family response regulator